MSSSGVIYAIIVGAWAVYLVPMWLRREDELNRARETQRYAAAIKVLAHKEAFERRWAQPGEAAEALPLAAGQGFVPSRRTSKRTAESGPGAKVQAGATEPWTPGPAKESSASKAAKRTGASVAATEGGKSVVTAATASPGGDASRARTSAAARTAPAPAAPKYPGPRTGLMARRRRVVGVLFTLTTLGALISADLGAAYLWAMALPAVLLSVYIVRLRGDERIRAAARARRRAAAQQAREAREAELQAREEARAQEARALAQAEAEARALEEAEAAQLRRAQAARRRSSAASRARAQTYVQAAPDLPRASNG